MAEQNPPDNLRVVVDRTNVPKAPTFVDIYANDAYVQTTPWDVRLMLAVLTEQSNDQNRPSPLRIADVRLSLHLAKRVAQLITAQIEQYEKDFGPLILPPTNDKT